MSGRPAGLYNEEPMALMLPLSAKIIAFVMRGTNRALA
jgi:hypothetical protein